MLVANYGENIVRAARAQPAQMVENMRTNSQIPWSHFTIIKKVSNCQK